MQDNQPPMDLLKDAEKLTPDELASTIAEFTKDCTPSQSEIVHTTLSMLALLLKKNADYGSSAWKRPVLAPDLNANEAIRVRMSDKISRLNNLLSKGTSGLIDESIEDTIKDLGAYCILLLAAPKDSSE